MHKIDRHMFLIVWILIGLSASLKESGRIKEGDALTKWVNL